VSSPPQLRRERRILRSGAFAVGGVDEVGRGAIAGPVTVGIVIVQAHTPTAPQGTRDSKLMSASTRERLAPQIRSWAADWAVGDATAAEIDDVGIIAAMMRALQRAYRHLRIRPDVIILDGHHDFASSALAALGGAPPSVVTYAGADRTCSSVAAASVLAKTHRDAAMIRLAEQYPGFGWDRNVGYGSREHRQALAQRGPTSHHRRSFAVSVPSPTAGDHPIPTG
jgi:ribonuclease HII